ncbi:hypothetical protein H1R20_g9622, partial [Candolleomyces eurysporus]
MGDIHYFEAPRVTVNAGGEAYEKLISDGTSGADLPQPAAKHTNAVLMPFYSSDRYDAPKCDEDTRVEVISELMGWIEDRENPQRLLCMTGAAGAGKSALQQTIAERCGDSNILNSSFFLSSSDPTRNSISAVVPTIAFQVGSCNDTLRRLIAASIQKDPLIFSKSLRTQMNTLIAQPFKCFQESGELGFEAIPYAILIDGLDECAGEDRQAELLAAIKQCLLESDLPFRICIASRPEWAIRSALEPGGYLHDVAYHIQLSDKYDASADIRRYLRRRLKNLGGRWNNAQWFSGEDIETLVQAASGQFIYAATVLKYISNRRGSPRERLKIVLTWTPHEGQCARPFESLDMLYMNVLLAAKKAYDAVDTHRGRDFALLFSIFRLNAKSALRVLPSGISRKIPFPIPLDHLTEILGLETGAEETLVSDLRSLVTFENDYYGYSCLHLYHKSLYDFLDERSRAKDLFVPDSYARKYAAKCCLQIVMQCPSELESVRDNWEELPEPSKAQLSSMRMALHFLPSFLAGASPMDDELIDFTQNQGWDKIDKFLPWVYEMNSFLLSYHHRASFGWVFDHLKPELWKLFAGDHGRKRTFSNYVFVKRFDVIIDANSASKR